MIEIKSYLILLLSVFCLHFFAQNKTIDFLKHELKNAKHDTTRCTILNELIEAEGGNEAVWPIYNKQLTDITETRLKTNTVSKSEYYFYQKNYAIALNNTGETYHNAGDIPKALEYFEKSLKISEEIGYKAGIANCVNNMGFVYYNQGDISKAIEYISKGLKIDESTGNKRGFANALNNIAFIYIEQGDPSITYSKKESHRLGLIKAMVYLRQSLKLEEEVGNKIGMANVLNNIGANYNIYGDPLVTSSYEESRKTGQTKALKYLTQSLKINEAIGNRKGKIETLNNLGNIYFKQKNYNKALETTITGMNLSKELGFPENIKNVASQLSKIYKAKNNYKSALENYELYIQMRDSISNQETRKASIKSQLKYEYEKKAAADSVKVVEEKKLTTIKLKQEQTQRYYLYGGLGLTIFFGIFMFNRFKITDRQKSVIEEQKLIVEKQKHIVDGKQKEILDSIRYAKRIQTALIPNEKYIQRYLQKLNPQK